MDLSGEWLPNSEIQRLINKTLEEKVFAEVVMTPGDLLYLPRGTVHYTEAAGHHGSAHITFGVDSGAVAWTELGKVAASMHFLSASCDHVNRLKLVVMILLTYDMTTPGCSGFSAAEAPGAVFQGPFRIRCVSQRQDYCPS